MSFRRHSLPCLLIMSIAAAGSTAKAETTQPSVQAPTAAKTTKPAKASGHIDKSKTEKADAIKPRAVQGNMQDTMFSDPGVPVMSPSSSPNPAPASSSAAKAAPEGAGAPSLSMKWHATSDNDPYDTVRHTSGADGQGESVLGGIKFGF
jgi:hypothetical protein